ncbi:MAG TPA: hypothetical protein VMH36_11615 [Alphaproteobacteria bacterium]|nr:hypothetical protein [Alphaproteobacteria bacterium]
MKRYEELREQAREKLHLAARATDQPTKQRLAESAFQLAQEAEALERMEQVPARSFGRTL